MRILSEFVLGFILIIYMVALSGCNNKYRPIIIETPPNRIAIAGELDDRQREVFYKALKIMIRQPYREHTYAHPMGASISHVRTVSESESNTVNVNRSK